MTRKQKNKIVKRRHQRYVVLANNLVAPILTKKVGYLAKRIDLKQYEPYLVVSNHVTAFDPILITHTFNRQVYYISTEIIFSKGLISRILEHTFAPIPKAKSQTDVASVKNIIQVVKEGGNVGIFVEGNSTMTGAISNVPTAIGKLVLLLKIPLVIFNFEGGYLSNPRWSISKRKRNMTGYVRKVVTYDEYKDMTPEEINELIIDGINVNAYKETTKREFPGSKNAEGLNRLLFTCPKCHGVNTVSTKGNMYTCESCGFNMEYDKHGYLHSLDFETPQNTIILDKNNKINYQEYLINHPEFTLSVEGIIHQIFRRNRRLFGQAKFTLNNEGLGIKYRHRKAKDVFIPFNELDTFAMQQKDHLVIYLKDGTTYMLSIDQWDKVSAYQYVVTFQVLQNVKQYQENHEDFVKLLPSQMGL